MGFRRIQKAQSKKAARQKPVHKKTTAEDTNRKVRQTKKYRKISWDDEERSW